MPRVQYTVHQSSGRWWVACGTKSYGPLTHEAEACHWATKIAQTYGEPGEQSVVMAKLGQARYRAVWSSCGTVESVGARLHFKIALDALNGRAA